MKLYSFLLSLALISSSYATTPVEGECLPLIGTKKYDEVYNFSQETAGPKTIKFTCEYSCINLNGEEERILGSHEFILRYHREEEDKAICDGVVQRKDKINSPRDQHGQPVLYIDMSIKPFMANSSRTLELQSWAKDQGISERNIRREKHFEEQSQFYYQAGFELAKVAGNEPAALTLEIARELEKLSQDTTEASQLFTFYQNLQKTNIKGLTETQKTVYHMIKNINF